MLDHIRADDEVGGRLVGGSVNASATGGRDISHTRTSMRIDFNAGGFKFAENVDQFVARSANRHPERSADSPPASIRSRARTPVAGKRLHWQCRQNERWRHGESSRSESRSDGAAGVIPLNAPSNARPKYPTSHRRDATTSCSLPLRLNGVVQSMAIGLSYGDRSGDESVDAGRRHIARCVGRPAVSSVWRITRAAAPIETLPAESLPRRWRGWCRRQRRRRRSACRAWCAIEIHRGRGG